MITQNFRTKLKIIASTLALAFTASENAFSAGYSTSIYSASGLGNSYAGSATGSHDISDLYFNPAISAGKKSNEVIISASYLNLEIDADNISSSSALGNISGGEVRNAGTQKLIPALYYANPINDELTFNFAITSPFGLATKYNKDWVGRYRGVNSDISTLNLNPSLAYKINKDLSIGAGFVAQRYSAELTKEAVGTGNVIGYSRLRGSDWGYGYNLGVAYNINENAKVGLGYRSKIDYKINGINSFNNNALYSKFSAKTTTPESLTLGGSYQVNSNTQLVADTTWTRWSRLKNFNVISNNSLLNGTTNFNWNDSMMYSLGSNYSLNKNNILRSGIAYEKEVVNTRNREPRIPTSDKYWLSAGLNHKLSDGLEIDLSYVRQIYKTAKINIQSTGTNGVEGTLTGKYKTSVDVISLALKKQF